MLWTIAVILAVLWLLGLVSSYTMGGFIHILLVLAIVVVLINVIQGRRACDELKIPVALPAHRQGSAPGANMNAVKITAIVLIVAGVLGLAYGSFSFTKQTHDVKIGPIEMSVQEKETVNIPVWAGVGAIAIGAALLLLGGRKA